MYYTESSKLTERSILDKDAVGILDREIAHAYTPDKRGYTELALLRHKTGLDKVVIERLMIEYEAAGVVLSYEPMVCPNCGERYDPDEIAHGSDEEGRITEDACINCGSSLNDAEPTGETFYRVLQQPAEPAYEPTTAPAEPDVFISYRRADTAKLAADIYYSLRAAGQSVFLDSGEIPVGAEPELVFLDAASKAKYFIALVSRRYFGSPYCKKEIAHAARKMRRLIRVNVPPVPSAPADMPWIDGSNWNRENGDPNGLAPELEQTLLRAIQTPASAPMADLRKEACQYLMEQLSFNGLDELWNRLPWMQRIKTPDSAAGYIKKIREETTTAARLDILSNALTP
jgi:hypothetical protein